MDTYDPPKRRVGAAVNIGLPQQSARLRLKSSSKNIPGGPLASVRALQRFSIPQTKPRQLTANMLTCQRQCQNRRRFEQETQIDNSVVLADLPELHREVGARLLTPA